MSLSLQECLLERGTFFNRSACYGNGTQGGGNLIRKKVFNGRKAIHYLISILLHPSKHSQIDMGMSFD